MSASPTPLPPVPEQRLLLNHETRSRLAAANLLNLADVPLELSAAHRLGLWLGAKGSDLLLFALLNAALRSMVAHYLAQQDFLPNWHGFTARGRFQRFTGFGELLLSSHRVYPLPGLTDDSLFEGAPRGVAVVARKLAVGELFLLDVQLDNLALRTQRELFDDTDLAAIVDWRPQLKRLSQLLPSPEQQEPWGRNLCELLRDPMRAAPESLVDQVAYVLATWAPWLPSELLRSLQVAQAIALEESRLRLPGPGPSIADKPAKDASYGTAAFSLDLDWMEHAVLIAKSVSVWLDQLSQTYGHQVHTLDQIPDTELDRLARWGFNALWLIGIWERSAASRRIKQLRGNPEAEASAYALHAYRVAPDLGGSAALANLEERCSRRGIRLACDVVPNHTGIDSEWVNDHPDWFIQCDQPPYPAYRFTGPDLSGNPAVSIRIEDGYWDHRDAAVVFEHIDHRNGQRRYIYHGNDGTHMPWNDTAQLNFMLPQVRQAMSDLIIATAQRFRLIRFDAAMTLARKHFRRLWFPPPGGSAGVPSRSAFWMEDEDFNYAFPREFWREIVDRIHAEAPDTLLIAEAFWLMESYFVRTLGMHRVYNSAFMNLLKQEENAKFRRILKDVLSFNPEILKRYVNFMNNPDEDSAVEQFGKGNKYFGVAVLLATLPGLPMFGHGQIEGFREKYGMEYRRAYWGESADPGFIAYHEAQIFPLLHRRHYFSGVDNFQMYDLHTPAGVAESVYAFSNGPAHDRYLIIYNNAPFATAGCLHQTTPKASSACEGVAGPTTTLAQQLGINKPSHQNYCRFRDRRDNCEYLRPAFVLGDGLSVTLEPYQYHVFHGFSLIEDSDGSWAALYAAIGDGPVSNLDFSHFRQRYQHLWSAWQRLIEPCRLHALAGTLLGTPLTSAANEMARELDAELRSLASQLSTPLPEQIVSPLADTLFRLANFLESRLAAPLRTYWSGSESFAYPLICWCLFEHLHRCLPYGEEPLWSRFQQVGLDFGWREVLPDGMDDCDLQMAITLIKTGIQSPPAALDALAFASLVRDPAHRELLGINLHEGELWFNRERMNALIAGLACQAAHRATGTAKTGHRSVLTKIVARAKFRLGSAMETGYRLESFLAKDAAWASLPLSQPTKKLPARPLRILMVASEAAPFAKTGGLGDVLGSLPPALQAAGADVRLVLPWYRSAQQATGILPKRKHPVLITLGGETRHVSVRVGTLSGVPVYFLDVPEFFDRRTLYGEGGEDYPDNACRFALLGRTALELSRDLRFVPDVVHAHDWQAAVALIDLRHRLWNDPFFAATGSLLTIHNLGYQGLFPPSALHDIDLDRGLLNINDLEFYGQVSLLKGGIRFANHVSTVSPTYCREIQTPAFGVGLDGLLRARRAQLHGILNGLDGRIWNPTTDPALPARYSSARLTGKSVCKAFLQSHLGLTQNPHVPLAAMVTRIDRQKGLDLLLEGWEALLSRGVQIVILGSGQPALEQRLSELAARTPQQVAVVTGFDDILARRIYAASDLFLMPSRYEPCGLGQLIALRYGSVPLVHATGGLADTIFDPQSQPRRANGFLFDEYSVPAFLKALDRLLTQRGGNPAGWEALVKRGMRQDFSWKKAAQHYLDLYRLVVAEQG